MPDIGSAPNKVFQRTDGTRTGPEAWQEADAIDVGILSVDHDIHDQDMANAISNRLMLDGGNQPSAAIPWNSQRITGYGVPTARTDAQRVDKVQDSAHTYAGASSGTDTITATLTPAITAYAAGQRFTFLAGGTNTGAATINFNSVGAKDLKKGPAGSTALAAGDITAGGLYTVEYDGTNFQLVDPGLARNVSAYIATLLDDADAATARTTLELGTIALQDADDVEITGGEITGITDLAVADGGTGASTAAGARTNLGAVLTDAVFPGAIVCIAEDNNNSGNGGGTLSSGVDNVRTLDVLIYNRNTMASLSSNRLTLPAGTWEIEWRAPAAGDADNGSHQSFLYNQTDGAEVKRGTSEEYNATSGGEMSNASIGSTVVTIAAPKAFEIRHRASYSGGTMIGGDSGGFGTEVYTRVIVRAA